MRLVFAALLCVLLTQDPPWTPFNDPTNRHFPERAAAIDVAHYDIRLTIDDKKAGQIEGETTVTLSPLAGTSRVELDAADMTVTSVKCAQHPTMFQQKDETLAIDFKGAVGKGEQIALTVGYRGKPRHGMFWVAPDAGYPDKHWMVWTQGETDYNHHWFPCYDFPNDRATWEIRVTYPAKYVSVSNGELAATTEKDGWKTDHWKQAVPAVAYLASLVVGDFEKVEDTFEHAGVKAPVQYFVPRGLHTEEEIRHTFGRTAAMMKFFSEKTGVAYPYQKYAQTVVHDFIWGGMENISATTLHGFTVIAKKSWPDRDSEGLIAHELAHQWFGDYVTCRDWAHIWLNESFATYFEALWWEHDRGADAIAEELADGAGWYFGQEKKYSRPIVCDVYSDPDDVFDACAYPKGAWVLHMLRKTIGDDAWWKGIKLYLARHAAKCAESKDFVAAMEEASGKKLGEFFDQWLHRTGHPEFEVTSTWMDSMGVLKVTVEQKQKVEDRACGPLKTGSTVFKTDAEIEVETPSGRKTHRVRIEKAREEFTIAGGNEPLLVEFDPDGWILKTLTYKKPQVELRHMLLKDDEGMGRAWAAGQLAEAEKPDAESVAALAKALEDPFAPVVRAAADALAKIKSSEGRQALVAAPAKVKDARARWAVYQALGAFLPGDDVEKTLLEAVATDASLNCRATAAQALGKRGPDAYETLKGLAEKFEKDEVILPGVLSGLQETGDAKAATVLARFTKYGLHPWIRGRAVQCLGDLLAKQDAGKRDKEGLDALIGLLDDPSFRIRRAVVDKLGGLGEERAVPALEKRIPQEFDGRLIKDIRDAVRKIRAPKK